MNYKDVAVALVELITESYDWLNDATHTEFSTQYVLGAHDMAHLIMEKMKEEEHDANAE